MWGWAESLLWVMMGRKVVSPTTRRGEKLPWHYLRVRMHAHLSDDLHLSILSPSL